MSTQVILTDAQLDELAERIADRLIGPATRRPQLVDAQTLAAMLGTSRDCVYRHAPELGGQRIGSGERGRLRFDPMVALERWTARPADSTPAQTATPRRRRPRNTNGVPLLPIRGER